MSQFLLRLFSGLHKYLSGFQLVVLILDFEDLGFKAAIFFLQLAEIFWTSFFSFLVHLILSGASPG